MKDVDFLNHIKKLIIAKEVIISNHGYDELADDRISVKSIIRGMNEASIVEYYPDYPKGPCMLALLLDGRGRYIHAVWGIPKNNEKPAVLITAYRPDPERWNDTYTERKK